MYQILKNQFIFISEINKNSQAFDHVKQKIVYQEIVIIKPIN